MAYKNFKITEIIEEIGAELKKIRVEQNYTINAVVNQLSQKGFHISDTLLCRMEKGARRIDDETLSTICDFYQVVPSSVVIAASKEHIKALETFEENADAISDDELPSDSIDKENLINLFLNLNSTGQQEVLNLMKLMAYMEVFKKEEPAT